MKGEHHSLVLVLAQRTDSDYADDDIRPRLTTAHQSHYKWG